MSRYELWRAPHCALAPAPVRGHAETFVTYRSSIRRRS
jgi:hypothetical protein